MGRRTQLLLVLLSIALGAAAQSSGQFLITLMDGRSFVRMLPPDCLPTFDGPFIQFTPRDRFFVADVAMVQPLHPDDIRGQHALKLLLRSNLGHGSQVVWVPDRFVHLDDAPTQNGFLVIGPQTLVRVGIYREALE